MNIPNQNKAIISRAVKELTKRLKESGQSSKKEWWEKYLKQTISFYGTPMGEIRKNLHQWHNKQSNNNNNSESNDWLLLPTAWELFRQPIAEQKLCAILILQELAFDQLVTDRDLPIIATLFDESYIYDWNTTDWFCVRVLGPWIQRNNDDNKEEDDEEEESRSNTAKDSSTANQIASWVDDKNATLWRKRASLVSFVNVTDDHYIDLQFEIASKLAPNQERFAQTAIGWVMSTINKNYSIEDSFSTSCGRTGGQYSFFQC